MIYQKQYIFLIDRAVTNYFQVSNESNFSADGNYEVRYKSNVLIYPDGEVLWVPPAIYQVL